LEFGIWNRAFQIPDSTFQIVNSTLRRSYTIPLPTGRVLRLGERCLVMGILNVTPDSFAESSSRLDPQVAIDAALRLQQDGADLIDIGGESTRPGAEPVSANEELARILPVVRALAGRLAVPMSVDTYKASVARAAIEAGAAMVNDVSALRNDPEMARVVAGTGAALVLMHTRGSSKTMYAEAVYEDVVGEVIAELRDRVQIALTAGVAIDQIIADPGIGFAKQAVHSYGVLAHLPELAGIGRPVLVGPSRKSFLSQAVDDRPAPQRDWGTAAAVTAAVLGGAHIVRVHAVEQMNQVVRVAEELRRHSASR
jgi:dihydropteroate synthase